MQQDVLRPRLTFPVGTEFGARMSQLAKTADPVARKVVTEFIREGHSAFISDGATAFGVGLHLFNNQDRVLVHTNNLALALESCMWQNMQVVVPAGPVDDRLCMVHGRRANQFARDAAFELEWTVLSVTALFGDHGPAGKEHTSIRIKRAAIEKPRRVIWIADYMKLSTAFNAQPLVYVDDTAWQSAANRGNVWVVTSRHPQAKPNENLDIEHARPNDLQDIASTELGRYRINRARLVGLLHERFVEVEPPPSAAAPAPLDDRGRI